jgi:hypothetical protein
MSKPTALDTELDLAAAHWDVRVHSDREGSPARNELAALRAVAVLLREWRVSPYFATEAEWRAWVQDFGPRVDAALDALTGAQQEGEKR